MCDLQSSPWRATFTGPPCRCGVPTPGNEEERKLDKQKRFEQAEARRKKEREEFAVYREQRIQELLARYSTPRGF